MIVSYSQVLQVIQHKIGDVIIGEQIIQHDYGAIVNGQLISAIPESRHGR